MKGRYYLTGVQIRMLMNDIDELAKMKILNKIMNDQFLGNVGDISKSMKQSIEKNFKEMDELFQKIEIKIKGMREYLEELNKLLEEK